MTFILTEAYMTLASPKFDRLVTFYQHFLRQQPIALIPNVYAEFQLPNLKLGIFRPQSSDTIAAPESQEHPISGMSLCLEVEDLEAAIADLTQLGYPPPGEILTASHGREIYAYDPDGNWMILHQSI